MEVVRNNQFVYLNYIVDDKESYKKIKTQISYLDNDGNNFKKEYELNPEEIKKGEELSKLIINDYIMNNSDLTEVEKIMFALKYQIFTKYTTLFAEVELSNKIPNEMKLKIIGNMENNVIKIKKQSKVYTNYNNNFNYNTSKNYLQNFLYQRISLRRTNLHMHDDDDNDDDDDWDNCDNDNNNSNNNQLLFHKSENNNNDKNEEKNEEKNALKEKKDEKIEIN